jgi:hypothetical protein
VLTQLMIAPPQAVFHVRHAGWNEIEYSDQMQRRWQWTTNRAETFVNAAGRDLTLTLSGESRTAVAASDRPCGQPGTGHGATVGRLPTDRRGPCSCAGGSDGMLTIRLTNRSFPRTLWQPIGRWVRLFESIH